MTVTDKNICKYAWFDPMCAYIMTSVVKAEVGESIVWRNTFQFTYELNADAPFSYIREIEINSSHLILRFDYCYYKFAALKLYPPGSQMILSLNGTFSGSTSLDRCIFYISEGYSYDETSLPDEIKLPLAQFEKDYTPENCAAEPDFSNDSTYYDSLLTYINYIESEPHPDCIDGIRYREEFIGEECSSALPIKFRICTDSRHLSET